VLECGSEASGAFQGRGRRWRNRAANSAATCEGGSGARRARAQAQHMWLDKGVCVGGGGGECARKEERGESQWIRLATRDALFNAHTVHSCHTPRPAPHKPGYTYLEERDVVRGRSVGHEVRAEGLKKGHGPRREGSHGEP